jgi:hypothetical protein
VHAIEERLHTLETENKRLSNELAQLRDK